MTASFRMALLAGAALLPCAPASAADVTPDQARAAEAAVRDWVGGMLGPSVKLPERLVVLTPAGDHFDVSARYSLPGTVKAGSGTDEVTLMAQARPLDGGKWAVDNIHTAMPLRFTIDVPVPPGDGDKGAANKGDKKATKATPATVPVTYTVDLKGQDGHGVVDPSLATPTTWTNTATGATIRTEGGPMPSETQVGAYNGTFTLQPAGPDRVDLSTDAAIQDYHMASAPGATVPLSVDMKVLRVALAVTGLNRAHAQTLTQNTAAVLASLSSSAAGTPPQVSPEVITAMLAALQDVASEMSLDETAEGLAVNAAGIPVTVGKAELGLSGKSVNGLLEARMPVEARDIGLGSVLPPDMAALVPTVFSIHPVVSGVGVAELSRIATAANANRDPAPADIQALFSHGGITIGVESMTLAMGGATFDGSGTFVLTSSDDGHGTGRIAVTGYDDLMQKAAAIPALSGKAVPVMAFIKGFGKAVDGKLVWDLSYKDGKGFVNDVDLASLGFGPSKTAPAPAPGATPHPAPQQRHPAARGPAK